jgi:hypothetical protein
MFLYLNVELFVPSLFEKCHSGSGKGIESGILQTDSQSANS